MASEGYHEPIDELSDETRDMHRAIVSLMEELEAVDWYNQRVDACKDPELRAILEHNRDEEKEHAAMVLEWIRRRDPRMDHELRKLNFDIIDFMRREMSGYQHSFISQAAQQVSVRSGRHIRGVAKITVEKLRDGGMPEQPLIYITRRFGSHSGEQKKGFAPEQRGAWAGFSAIPYGALIPDEFDNVLACGRCISVDDAAMDTIRMMTTCMAMGQAAGTAASIAVDDRLPVMTNFTESVTTTRSDAISNRTPPA